MKMRTIRGDGCVGLVDGVANSVIDSRINERGNPIPTTQPRLEQRQFEEDVTPRSENINDQTPQRETARLRALLFPHPDGTDLYGGADDVHFAHEEERGEAVDLEAQDVGEGGGEGVEPCESFAAGAWGAVWRDASTG